MATAEPLSSPPRKEINKYMKSDFSKIKRKRGRQPHTHIHGHTDTHTHTVGLIGLRGHFEDENVTEMSFYREEIAAGSLLIMCESRSCRRVHATVLWKCCFGCGVSLP